MKRVVFGVIAVLVFATDYTEAVATEPRGIVRVAVTAWGGQQFDAAADLGEPLPYVNPMFDGIIGANPDGTVSKTTGAVMDWQVARGGIELVLQMRPGMKFHDETEATAEDLAFSLQRYAAPDSNSTSRGALRNVKEITVVSRYMVRVILNRPDAAFIPGVALVEGDALLVKKNAYRQTEKGWALTNPDKPVGTGPYKLARRKIGEFVEYEAFDQYWNPQRKAGFKVVHITLVAEPSTRLSALRTGDLDLAPLNPEQVAPAKNARLQVLGPQNAVVPMLAFFGSDTPDFLSHKLEFRKAMILGYDKRAIVKRLYTPEIATMATGTALFSPLSLGWDASLEAYRYSPDEAKRLLKAAGYDNGIVKVWAYPFATVPEIPTLLEAISGYWQGLGVKIEYTPVDWPTFSRRLFSKPQQWDKRYAAHVAILTPVTRPWVLNNMNVFMLGQESGGMAAAYWNPEKIARLRGQLAQTTTVKQLDEELREVNRDLYQEYWADPVVFRHLPFGATSRICGWSPINGTGRQLELSTLRPCP